MNLAPYYPYVQLTGHAPSGIGLFFSAFMICLTALQARYTGFSPENAEEFSSASRSVKPGLIAAGIVSAWTWAATLVSFGINKGIPPGVDIFSVTKLCRGL